MTTLRRLWSYGSGVRVRLIAALFLGACASAAAVALTATSAFLISKASQQPPILTLSVAIVGVRFFGISRGVARYAERLVGHDATFGVMSRLRAGVYARVERLAPAGLPLYRSGDLLSRFVRDVDDSQELFLRVLPPYVIAGCVGAATCAFLLWVLPAAGVICALGLGIAALVVPRLASHATQQEEQAIATDRAAISSQTLEWFSALPELAVAGTADLHAGRINDTSERVRKSESQLVHTRGLSGSVVMVLLGATVLGCLVVGSRAVTTGQLDGVMLAVIALTPLAAFDLITPLPEAFQRWHLVQAASARIFDVMDQPDVVSEPAQPLATPARPITVELRTMSARWPGSRQLNLRDITLRVAPGDVVAVVGPSGAGKSTLAAVLVGFLRCESGRYLVNGVSADDLTTAQLRTGVGLLTQDSYVFDSTIRENLLIGDRSADDPRLADALRQAQLWDWVEQLPDGLATFVGEHGARMSGGQRQRLCLARLLLADFPVVVLDEPAEHLDRESAQQLMADLLWATRGKARVVITHQLSDTAEADQVIVLDDGRIRESGSPEQLVAMNGWYATTLAWQTQQRG